MGTPIATSEEHTTRLPKRTVLPVFASDAISSTAYATQEILIVLIPAVGNGDEPARPHHRRRLPPARRRGHELPPDDPAYPHGGGTYIVSKDNLGEIPAFVVGASILVDYVLTVAVSDYGNRGDHLQALPGLGDACAAVPARGDADDGRQPARPQGVGHAVRSADVHLLGGSVHPDRGRLVRHSGDLDPVPPDEDAIDELTGGAAPTGFSVLIMLRAFASGAVALTGVEAIADGVPAFRRPSEERADDSRDDGDDPRDCVLRHQPPLSSPRPDAHGAQHAVDPRHCGVR